MKQSHSGEIFPPMLREFEPSQSLKFESLYCLHELFRWQVQCSIDIVFYSVSSQTPVQQ